MPCFYLTPEQDDFNQELQICIAEALYDMADRPTAGGAIGKQISTITLPRDINKAVQTGYSSDEVTYQVVMPDMVVSIDDKSQTVIGDISVRPVDLNSAGPMTVPKVGRNQPCPCGSGRKYKKCHGRK